MQVGSSTRSFAAVLLGACAASLVTIAILAAPPARAASCALTTDATTPVTPLPGEPCWVDVTPYPFGVDGDPVDSSSYGCASDPIVFGGSNVYVSSRPW